MQANMHKMNPELIALEYVYLRLAINFDIPVKINHQDASTMQL